MDLPSLTTMHPLMIHPFIATLGPLRNLEQSHLQYILTTLQLAVTNLKQVCLTSIFIQSSLHPARSPTMSIRLPT